MEKEHTVSSVSEPDVSTPNLTEDTMELMTELMTVQLASRTTWTNPCTHSRMIDDVLTRMGKRTGQVRCLECGVVFDDPTQSIK